jgi:hypothetical protein
VKVAGLVFLFRRDVPAGASLGVMKRNTNERWSPERRELIQSCMRSGVACNAATEITLIVNLFLNNLLRRLQLKLTVIQLGIEPILFDELMMAALLNDVTLTHHQDQVGVADGG